MTVSRRSAETAPASRAHAAAFSAKRSTVRSSERASAKAPPRADAPATGEFARPTDPATEAAIASESPNATGNPISFRIFTKNQFGTGSPIILE
jgi:hypothetical protein